METEAAEVLEADLFGASESATLRYNDKASFKTLCRRLGIPVVEGNLFEMYPENSENRLEMKEIINSYLSKYKTVIIRGTLGEAGMSLYKTEGNDISDLYRQIANSGEKMLIIEPFLNVVSSPNDQWVIGRDGKITHLGMREQICERGMVHVATLKGEKTSPDVLNYIAETSVKIVNNMAESGYRGVVGIDYIVSEEGIFPIENNARFNGSSYVSMIVDNIEKLKSPIPYWKFIKIKTAACTFPALTERIKPVLYNNNKLNSVFPFDCDELPETGNFAVILLARNLDQILYLEKSLKELGVKRDQI
jgi:biotin carboxylase